MRFQKTLLKATTAAALFGKAALAQMHWVSTWGAAPSPQLQTARNWKVRSLSSMIRRSRAGKASDLFPCLNEN